MGTRAIGFASVVMCLAACGGGTTPPDSGGMDATVGTDGGGTDAGHVDLGAPDAGPPLCHVDSDCSDGVYCNGSEGCSSGATGADARGCVAGTAACMAGQTCNETMRTCTSTSCTTPDADGDGHRSTACGGDDCDDSDANRYPGNHEVCDTAMHDEDCDPATFGFRDDDGDGDPDARCCNVGAGGTTTCGTDCNDARPDVNITASEVCDGLDNNCNGMVDEGVRMSFYPDVDHDLHGDATAAATLACSAPPGFVPTHDDCDDTNAARNPGLMEICNGVDDDCDGSVDDLTGGRTCSCMDGTVMGCMQPGVCMAGNQTCVGGAWGPCSVMPTIEVCNGLDDDCNGTVDDGVQVTCYADDDNDGYAAPGATAVLRCPDPASVRGGCPPVFTNVQPTDATNSDCNDALSTIHPSAVETCNGTDDNCDGTIDEGVTTTYYADCDGDGHGTAATSGATPCGSSRTVAACAPPSGYSSTHDDCDDSLASVFPGAGEACDGIDNNCNSLIDDGAPPLHWCVDADGDGWSVLSMCMDVCTRPGASYRVTAPTDHNDCNDADPSVHPDQAQGCAAVDNDCNPLTLPTTPTWYADCDNDGWAAVGAAAMTACTAPATPPTCTAPAGLCVTTITPSWENGHPPSATTGTFDCDDFHRSVNPGQSEACDGLDTNCNGLLEYNVAGVAEDSDGDHYPSASCHMYACAANIDCNDSSGATHPGATDTLADGIDENCDAHETCYVDADTDAARSISATVLTTDTTCTAVGHARSTAAIDCCETDGRAHPGQTTPYPTATTGCTGLHGGYDFNCDNTSVQQYPAASTLSCIYHAGFPGTCSMAGMVGFVAPVPACGAPGTVEAACVVAGLRCTPVPLHENQACL